MNETGRLEALSAYDIMDTPEESDYDEIVRIASTICKTPISLITLLDANRQWFKASIGMSERETRRDISFCTHAILQNDMTVVPDTTLDARFRANPMVTGPPDIRFYAGMPLVTPDGHKLGTLCVMDTVPRTLSDEQLGMLRVLAQQVINHLEARLRVKELEQALNTVEEQRQALANMNAHQSRLISIVGHDVRGPLAALQGMLALLEDGQMTGEELREMSVIISNQVATTLRMLNNLVEWGGKGNQGQPDYASTNLNRQVEQVLMSVSATATAKGNRLVFEPDEEIHATTDQNMVTFVLRNLIQNAIKFTDQGTIAVSLSNHSDKVAIRVADTGSGLSEKSIQRLFNWEYRLSKPGTHGELGSGLGLVMCHEFVRKLGGEILVESQLGVGTAFTVVLPVEGNAAAS